MIREYEMQLLDEDSVMVGKFVVRIDPSELETSEYLFALKAKELFRDALVPLGLLEKFRQLIKRRKAA